MAESQVQGEKTTLGDVGKVRVSPPLQEEDGEDGKEHRGREMRMALK